jgi:flagellar basal-body rod protein FlgB
MVFAIFSAKKENAPNSRISVMLKEMLFDYNPDRLLGKMLDKAALAQRVISSNITNVVTPGYQRLGVSFEQELQKAVRTGKMKLAVTDNRHMPSTDRIQKLQPEVVQVDDPHFNGINNVNIDTEMVDLAKNQLDFDMATRLLSDRFNVLRMAIRGRR